MTDPQHLIHIDDVSPTELRELLALARAMRDADRMPQLTGRSLGLLFDKQSTRTRVSFEVGMTQLDGHAVFLDPGTLQLERGEPIADTARALSGYLDAIAVRMTDHHGLETLAEAATVPVINALTEAAHPCQTLADLLTIGDHCGEDATVAWVGDGNNVASSLAVGAAMADIELRVATPPGYGLDEAVLKRAAAAGRSPQVMTDPRSAVADADIVYTDVWVSMGDEDGPAKLAAFEGFQVDQSLLDTAAPAAKVMHCLPAVRGQEIAHDVLDGDRSLVWTQAENRLYAQQALLAQLIEGGPTEAGVNTVESYQGLLPLAGRSCQP